ncbi:MAG: glycosyltransferase [Cecembia sp.]
MQLIYISRSKIPSKEANSIHVMQMCDALSKKKEVSKLILLTLDTPTFGKSELEIREDYGVGNNFEIKRLWYPSITGSFYIYAIQVFFMLLKIKPDLVIGRSVHGCFASTLIGFPTIFDSHGPIWESGKLPLKMFQSMVSRTSFKKLTTNSKALKNIYCGSGIFQKTNFNPDNIKVIENGANLYNLDKKVQLPGYNEIKIGYLGHLYKGRGVEIIISCAKELPNLDFIIIGGEDEDINYWKNKFPNLKNLHFLGFKPFSQVYKYRNSCDILLAPYQNSVSTASNVNRDQAKYMNPIKIIEYMSAKKPIIASNLPVIQDILTDEDAILVNPERTRDWVEAIEIILRDKNLSEKLRQNSYNKFISNYTWDARASKILED